MNVDLHYTLTVFLTGLMFIVGIVVITSPNRVRKAKGVWIWDYEGQQIRVFKTELEARRFDNEIGYGEVYFLGFDVPEYEDL